MAQSVLMESSLRILLVYPQAHAFDSEDSLLDTLMNFDIIDIKHEEQETVIVCTTKSLDSACNTLKEQKYNTIDTFLVL
jgi:transcriptional/translational regulatory protein YebC/TACO1